MVAALACSIFADTIYMKSGNNVENATLTKITQTDIEYKVGGRDVIYTIPKDDVMKVKYNDGSEDVFAIIEQPVAPLDSLTGDSTKTEIEKYAEEFMKREANRTRFFRFGIELNSLIWRDIEYFDNSFPYTALGGGLFFRIGPEKTLYLTTGLYFKYEKFERQLTTRDFASAFGLSIPSIIDKPLLDLKWEKKSFEIPLLLNFGSEQIKFSGGILFEDYNSKSFINGYEIGDDTWSFLNEFGIDSDYADEINEKFGSTRNHNLYWVLGLDFDITRNWGVGIKFLTWNSSLGSYKPTLIERGSQARISTYFVL